MMLIIFSIVIFLFSFIALISSSVALVASDRIFYGVNVQDIPLGGLTKTEAQAKIIAHYQDKLGNQPLITIQGKEQTWEIKPADIDFLINTEQTAESAYQVGRENNLFKRLWTRIKSAQSGISIPYAVLYHQDKLKTIIAKIAVSSARDTEDAHCQIKNGIVTIVPEKIGHTLHTEELKTILQKNLSAMTLPVKLPLPLTEVQPKIIAAELKKMDRILAAYTTSFNHYNTNRSENIKISANSINHLLVKPDEVVSFNDLVGLRVAEAGFKEAPVIIEGKTVPDIGGGVCQVSSTLYNAILLADLKPVERTPHFHPLGYVPIGLDATVADNLLDFKFKNSLSSSIYIVTQIVEGDLTIFVLGNAANLSESQISLTATIDKELPPKTTVEYDATLAAGKQIVKEEGLTGYIVSSYRIKSLNGQEISRELLYTDEYSPEDKMITIGTKASPSVAPLASPSQVDALKLNKPQPRQ